MIFVTGGAGFIGSHACVELLSAGFSVTVFDNFSNSQPEALNRVRQITGAKLDFIQGDIRDRSSLEAALRQSKASAVIHFAGLKAVGESINHPLSYYDNNVVGTVHLLQAMQACDVKSLVFSSSATVYGHPQYLPLNEDHPLSSTNPYGQTKLVIENMLRDLYRSDPTWHISILRYFNPVGAHASGLIGEAPQGTPNNLLPYVAQVAVGRREFLSIWGNDYETPDGTGVRDYIHVVDLALGHLAALRHLERHPQCCTVNLGTGIGYSVLEVVRAFEHSCGKTIPFKYLPRRTGDVASCHADPTLARELLGWQAQRDMATMCQDAWNWQSKNPNGYSDH